MHSSCFIEKPDLKAAEGGFYTYRSTQNKKDAADHNAGQGGQTGRRLQKDFFRIERMRNQAWLKETEEGRLH
jgi:hypothetical protein